MNLTIADWDETMELIELNEFVVQFHKAITTNNEGIEIFPSMEKDHKQTTFYVSSVV